MQLRKYKWQKKILFGAMLSKLKKKAFDYGPFNFGKWQQFATMISWLDNFGLTINDVFTYINERREEFRKEEEWMTAKHEMREFRSPPKLPPIDRFYPRYCPQCKQPMLLYEVNTKPDNQTGDDSKSVHNCTNDKCREQIFYPEDRETLKRRRYT